MKKILVLMTILAALGTSQMIQAQNVTININIDSQPAWGPTGYDYAAYYYIPDLNIYYDVANALFYYLDGGEWIPNRYLPMKYRRYDLYSLYKIVINDRDPWMYNRDHRRMYKEYREDRTQVPIRFNSDNRYSKSRQNYSPWVNHDNGNQGNGQGMNQGNMNNNNRNNNYNNNQGGQMNPGSGNQNNQRSSNNGNSPRSGHQR